MYSPNQCSNKATKKWHNKPMAIGIFLCLEKCTIIPASVVHRQKRRSVIHYPNDRNEPMSLQRIYPPRNKQIAQILLKSLIFSIFQRNNFGNKGGKYYFCK